MGEELEEVSFSHSESLEAASQAAAAAMTVGVGANDGGPALPVDLDNNTSSRAVPAAPNAARRVGVTGRGGLTPRQCEVPPR